MAFFDKPEFACIEMKLIKCEKCNQSRWTVCVWEAHPVWLNCVSLQYSAVDSNPLSVYVMHPFWNFVVKVRKTCSVVCVCACIINEVSSRLLWCSNKTASPITTTTTTSFYACVRTHQSLIVLVCSVLWKQCCLECTVHSLDTLVLVLVNSMLRHWHIYLLICSSCVTVHQVGPQ